MAKADYLAIHSCIPFICTFKMYVFMCDSQQEMGMRVPGRRRGVGKVFFISYIPYLLVFYFVFTQIIYTGNS